MIKVYEAEEFDNVDDRHSSAVFEDLEFRKCAFNGCLISHTEDPAQRSTVRNVRILNCEAVGCFLGPAIVEDVMVDSLKIPKRLISKGALFKHVVLKGRIDRLILGPIIPNLNARADYRKSVEDAFQRAQAEYYEKIDWALDISEADFSDFDVRGIPSRLIRRDPFTQAVVKREKILDGKWRKLDLSGTWWPVCLEMLEKSNWEDDVLIAPKRHRQFSQALKGIYILRDAGIAEPD